MASAYLIHISDPHIGSKLSGGGLVPHSNGHDRAALEAFCHSRNAIVDGAKDDGVLVVSGDVSAHGSDDELGMYRTFRDLGVVQDAYFVHDAFAKGFEAVLDVPGNHDLWGGAWLWALPAARVNLAARAKWFTSWQAELPLGAHLVAVHGLCSTSGATGRQQFFAVGSFRDEDCDAVARSVDASTRKAQQRGLEPFHLLVIHHSPAHGSASVNGLDVAGRQKLQALCARCRIRGILTGHAHSRQIVPKGILPVQQRSFWQHELIEEGQTLVWRATPWVHYSDPFLRARFVRLGERSQLVSY